MYPQIKIINALNKSWINALKNALLQNNLYVTFATYELERPICFETPFTRCFAEK